MSGTGPKKWMPTTLSGRDVAAAMEDMGMAEVLVPMMVWGGQIPSSLANTSFLSSIFSWTASITMSAAAASFRSQVVLMQARALSACSPLIFSRERSLPSELSMASMPEARHPSLTSHITTSYPARAATWAMPFPMYPAPATKTFLLSTPSLLLQGLLFFLQYGDRRYLPQGAKRPAPGPSWSKTVPRPGPRVRLG